MPAARSLRLKVQGGSLVLHLPGGALQRLAEPGTVQRAVLLDDQQARAVLGRSALPGGALVLLGADGPLVTLRPVEWSPPAPASGAELLETSGATDLVHALGLSIEPAEDLDAVRGAGRTIVSPLPPVPPPGRATWPVAILAMLVGFAAWPANGTGAGAALTALCLLLAGALVLAVAHGRAQAVAAERSKRPPGGRVVVRARAVDLPAGLSAAVLEISTDDVVVVDSGREAWVPGPRAGGITKLVAEPVALRFMNGSGQELLRVATAVFASDKSRRADLYRACRHAGIEVVTEPLTSVTYISAADPVTATVPPSRLQSPAESGDPSQEALYASTCAAALGLGGAIGVLTWSVPVAAVLALGALVELGLVAALAACRRRQDRAATSVVRPGASAA